MVLLFLIVCIMSTAQRLPCKVVLVLIFYARELKIENSVGVEDALGRELGGLGSWMGGFHQKSKQVSYILWNW